MTFLPQNDSLKKNHLHFSPDLTSTYLKTCYFDLTCTFSTEFTLSRQKCKYIPILFSLSRIQYGISTVSQNKMKRNVKVKFILWKIRGISRMYVLSKENHYFPLLFIFIESRFQWNKVIYEKFIWCSALNECKLNSIRIVYASHVSNERVISSIDRCHSAPQYNKIDDVHEISMGKVLWHKDTHAGNVSFRWMSKVWLLNLSFCLFPWKEIPSHRKHTDENYSSRWFRKNPTQNCSPFFHYRFISSMWSGKHTHSYEIKLSCGFKRGSLFAYHARELKKWLCLDFVDISRQTKVRLMHAN